MTDLSDSLSVTLLLLMFCEVGALVKIYDKSLPQALH